MDKTSSEVIINLLEKMLTLSLRKELEKTYLLIAILSTEIMQWPNKAHEIIMEAGKINLSNQEVFELIIKSKKIYNEKIATQNNPV